MAWLSEMTAGFSRRRSLPRWRSDVFDERAVSSLPGWTRQSISSQEGMDSRGKTGHDGAENGREVVLFADTFNRYFERENLDAALTVLTAAGFRVHIAKPIDGQARPLCCGRTFLSIGMVDEAKTEAERSLAALAPFIERGIPVVGLEPSCLLGFRDEIPALLKSDQANRLAGHALLFEEFLAREADGGRLDLRLNPIAPRALLHGHCHQKAFDAFTPVERLLNLIPNLSVEPIESSCCGMAGSFGFAADTIDVSLAMGELSLFPAVRKAPGDAIIVADGTSCRHQIRDGAGREALHAARVLAMSLVTER